jgi:exodeoxyribonuclease VIII
MEQREMTATVRLSKVHIMVDLETMGVGNDAAIISIGAVKFDPRGSGVLDAFYTRVDLSSSLAAGLTVTGSTIEWWLKEDLAEARKALKSSEPMQLWEALTGFVDWYEAPIPAVAKDFDNQLTIPPEGVWGNGATFDNVILRSAYNKLNLECPWSFRLDRCYRTLKALAPTVPVIPVGVGHQALDDATTQALHMQVLCEELGIDP